AADSTHTSLGNDRRARGAAIARRARAGQLTPEQMQRLQQLAGRRRGLNENYARELMELHTLGVDGGYTQKDVIEVARALTGWTMNPRTGEFVFRPEMHDAGTKVVLGHLLPAGRGMDDGEQVLDIVARHPSTARVVTAQLVARLGQPIFGRQTPDGWPDRGDAWMNTGAILNRINFGLAVAAGRVPGASLASWPYGSSLRGVSRPAQVDGVIKSILGGQSSTATRSILMSGENPLMSKLATADSSGRDIMNDPMSDDMAGTRQRQAGDIVRKNGVPRPNAASPLNRPVNLEGLAQVVG